MPDIYIASPVKKKPLPKKGSQHFENLVKDVVGKITRHPLSAFLTAPKNVSFDTQGDDEQIVLLLRRHWVVNIPWIALIILLILAPLCLYFFPLLSFLPTRFKLMAIIMWYLLVLSFLFEKFLWWFFNVFIITNKRVIDIDFYSLVYKEISEAEIEKIQDITYRTGGLMSSVFNFGTVLVQTAGKEPQIEFEDIPQPAKVVKILSRLAREA